MKARAAVLSAVSHEQATRSYRDTKSGAMDAVQEPTAAQRGCGERPTKRSADRGGCSRVMTRLEQRSGDAIAFMAASVVA